MEIINQEFVIECGDYAIIEEEEWSKDPEKAFREAIVKVVEKLAETGCIRVVLHYPGEYNPRSMKKEKNGTVGIRLRCIPYQTFVKGFPDS